MLSLYDALSGVKWQMLVNVCAFCHQRLVVCGLYVQLAEKHRRRHPASVYCISSPAHPTSAAAAVDKAVFPI